jgi:type II secretory pathway component GspD/PulD (secretin)
LIDQDQRGIDWNLLYRTTAGGNPLAYGLTGNNGGTLPTGRRVEDGIALLQERSTIGSAISNQLGLATSEDPGPIASALGEKATGILTGDLGTGTSATGGPFSIGGRLDMHKLSINMLLNFLNQYGSVRLVSQPNLTTLNGSPAYISSGNDFYFIKKVDTTVTEGVTLQTATAERIKVGLSLSVTPRVLDDDRILIDIVPILSELRNFDTLGFDITTPNIALQELSTQVITRSGVPIKLGGLISSRFIDQINRLPFAKGNSMLRSIFDNYLFKSDANSKERHELVIVVTPKLVES